MMKKTYFVLLLVLVMLVASTASVSAYDGKLTITDDARDVEKTDEAGEVTSNTAYPDIDLVSLSFEQDEKQVDVTMKLAEGGKFQEDIYTYYLIVLLTTSAYEGYTIQYTGANMVGETSSPITIVYGADEEETITVDTYTGQGTDTLEFSFDLLDKNERLITAMVMNAKIVGEDTSYTDVYPQNLLDIRDDMSEYLDIEIDAGSTYEVMAGNSLELSGTIVSGEITDDYEWFWTFDENIITLEGQNPSHTFNIPDTYTGTLYVYDGKGSWGLDTFQVNVTGTSTNSDGSDTNDQPGFELILVVAAVAIALLLFRKKKK